MNDRQLNRFGLLLKKKRSQECLTTTELATRSRIPQSLISGLENGTRRVGEQSAEKIGSALKLNGSDLDSFVFSAMDTSSEKVLKRLKGYPTEIINLVTGRLHQVEIFPETIVNITSSAYVQGKISKTKILLTDGRSVDIDISVA